MFDQHPCNYEQVYFVEVIDKATGEIFDTMPAFIEPDGEVIFINTPEGSDDGDYSIQVCSTIMNSPETTDCTEFDLTVEASPSGEIIKVEPEFMVNLQDQRVKVGDSLIYSLEDRLSSYGHEMTVTMNLDDVDRFASYDDSLNLFKVNGNLLEASDVGNYTISIEATYSNETFSESYTKSFTLTVWDDIEIEIETETIVEEPWFPEDPIYYPDWEPENVIRSNMTQEEDKERPIP